jgi:hypothetical protein
MSALCGDVYCVFAEVDAVDEGRCAELDLMLLEELLEVYLAYNFPTLNVPVNNFGVIAGR